MSFDVSSWDVSSLIELPDDAENEDRLTDEFPDFCGRKISSTDTGIEVKVTRHGNHIEGTASAGDVDAREVETINSLATLPFMPTEIIIHIFDNIQVSKYRHHSDDHHPAWALGLTCMRFYLILTKKTKICLPKGLPASYASAAKIIGNFLGPSYRLPIRDPRPDGCFVGYQNWKFLKREIYDAQPFLHDERALKLRYHAYTYWMKFTTFMDKKNHWSDHTSLKWAVPNPWNVGTEWYSIVATNLSSAKLLGQLERYRDIWLSDEDKTTIRRWEVLQDLFVNEYQRSSLYQIPPPRNARAIVQTWVDHMLHYVLAEAWLYRTEPLVPDPPPCQAPRKESVKRKLAYTSRRTGFSKPRRIPDPKDKWHLRWSFDGLKSLVRRKNASE